MANFEALNSPADFEEHHNEWTATTSQRVNRTQLGSLGPARAANAVSHSALEGAARRRMINFFGWNGGGAARTRRCSSDSEAQHQLATLCKDLEGRPLVQEFVPVLQALNQVLHVWTAPEAAFQAARAAVAFLKPYTEEERTLEFLLSSHTHKEKMESCAASMKRALVACQSAGLSEEAELQHWPKALEGLRQKCREVFELHFYAVFLDVKGDKVLLEQLFRWLSAALQLPLASIQRCLARTRPWAEEALQAMARRKQLRMLQRLHERALQQWNREWQEASRPESGKLGVKFWDSSFCHLFKIAWPDFVEAFENFYVGRCPNDLVRQLRAKVDPNGSHQVTRNSWQLLLQDRSRISDIVDILLEEVLSSLPECIYREPPEEEEVIDVDVSEWHVCESSKQGPQSCGEPLRLGFPSPQSTPQVAKPWVPFAHSTADDDMSIPTQTDVRHPTGASLHGARDSSARVAWDDFVSDLCASHKPWWMDPEDEASSASFALREAALRAVDSCISCTRRSLIFRVVSGDLGQNRPVLQMPAAHVDEKPQAMSPSSPREAPADFSTLPALVVAANGSRFSGVTKFGRSSSKRTLAPDCPMSEPIASRSHFNVIHDQETDQFYIMDAGSKWGTFVKIGSTVTLSCGDWIRVGGVEFIVRFCGGGCKCQKSHIHYRLHSLKIEEERHKGMWLNPKPKVCFSDTSPSSMSKTGLDESKIFHGNLHQKSARNGGEELSDDDIQAEMLTVRKSRGWMSAASRLCCAATDRPIKMQSGTCIPVAPLELDFISGPRMGEKIVLLDRVCTLGRGEGNTIQVTDSQLASVSRVHCIFELLDS
eukprot:s3969_g2.t1